MTSIKKIMFLPIVALYLSACSNSVDDTWPGVGELAIENFNRNSDNSFNLNSKLLFPGIGPGVSFTIESACKRRRKTESEPSFTKNTFKSSSKFEARPKQPKTEIKIINLLADEVLIFPNFFESCNFKIEAQNDVGSSDSAKLENIIFKYDKNHDLKLDSTEVTQQLRESLFQARSPLKALYAGGIEPKENINSDPTILINPPIESRIEDAELICYAEKLNQFKLHVKIGSSDTSVETLRIDDYFKLHDSTPGKPLENCIFSATDIDGNRVTSSPFDLIRDFNKLNVSIEYDNLSIIQNLADQQIDFSSNNENEIPETPITYLSVDYTNTSNEEVILHLGPSYNFSNTNAYLIKKINLPNDPNDEVAIDRNCQNNNPVYKYRYFTLDKTPLPSRAEWSSAHLKTKDSQSLLVIPSGESGTLELSIEIEPTALFDLKVWEYDSIIVAPNLDDETTNISFTSPNEFKLNPIMKNSIKDVFYPNQTFSSLPENFRNESDNAITSERVFTIVMNNTSNMGLSTLISNEERDLTRVRQCLIDTQPSTTHSSDGIETLFPE